MTASSCPAPSPLTPTPAAGSAAWRRLATFARHHAWEINALLFLIPLVLGYVGFQQFWIAQGKDYPPLALLYQSLQLFVLQAAGEASGSVNPSLEAARWLAPATTVYAAVKAIFALLSDKLRRLRVRRWQGHTLVWGWSENARRLIPTLHASGQRVVVVSEMTPSVTELCQDLNLPLFSGEIATDDLLSLVNAGRAAHIFCVHDDDAANVAIAAALWRMPGHLGQLPPTCFVHITDPLLFQLLVETDLKATRPERVDLEYFNSYDRGARALLEAWPLAEFSAAKPPRLLIAGLGPLAERLLIHLARAWQQQASGVPLPITLVAPAASTQLAALALRYPALHTLATWRCLDQDPLTLPSQGFNPFSDGEGPILAFACLENDGQGLATGLLLARAFAGQAATVVAALSGETAGFATLLGQDPARNDGSLRIIGWRERVCSAELASSGITEIFARAQHQTYLRTETAKRREQIARGESPAANPALAPWEELAESYRNANRDQARDLGNKLRLIGCTLLEDLEVSEPAQFTPEEIERLSQMEHDRWMRERREQGWTYGPVRDNAQKIHPDLIPWEDLTEEVREQDRVMIRNIPHALSLVGLRIYRLPSRAELSPDQG